MNKQETEHYLATLSPLSFCPYCETNYLRQTPHLRDPEHKRNFRRVEEIRKENPEIYGTYEDLLSHGILFFLVRRYMAFQHLSDEEYEKIEEKKGEDNEQENI